MTERRFMLCFIFAIAVILFTSKAYAIEVTVAACRGNVEYKDLSEKKWMVLTKDTQLKKGMQILTHEQSSCSIRIGDSALELEPNTFAVLSTVDPTQVDIQSGKVFAIVRNLSKGSQFRIVSPIAIGAARGTMWSQSMDDIQCYEGEVWVIEPDGRETHLLAGFGMRPGQAPRQLTEREINDAKDKTDILSDETGVPRVIKISDLTEEEVEQQESARDISPSA